MKKFFSILVFVSLLVLPSFALSVPSNHLVTAGWLGKHLGDKNLVVVDVSSAKGFAKGHIAGAVNIPKKMFFTGKAGSTKALLPTKSQIEKLFSNAGISNNSTVVFTAHVKKAKKFADMTRGLWVAWVYGMRDVAILDGGLEAWMASGKKLSTTPSMVKRGNFKATSMSTSDLKSLIDMQAALVNKDVQIVDAREMKHFVGKDKDKRLTRHGHIPGAKKLSAYLFAKKDGKLFKLVSANEAKNMIKKAGLSVNKPIIAYCNTGHLATGTWFAAKFLAGAKQIGTFDGSMWEYSRSTLPVVK